MDQATYPKVLTATKRVTRKTDRQGKKYVSTRMMVANERGGDAPVERTVRVFGTLADVAVTAFKKDVPVRARVAFDSFTGEGGRGQSLRVVSIGA